MDILGHYLEYLLDIFWISFGYLICQKPWGGRKKNKNQTKATSGGSRLYQICVASGKKGPNYDKTPCNSWVNHGKSTISTGPLSMSLFVCLPEGTSSSPTNQWSSPQFQPRRVNLLEPLQSGLSRSAKKTIQNHKIPCLFGLDLHMAFHKWLYPHSWMVYNGKAVIKIDDLAHDGSMVLLYMVTWIPSIYPSHVSIYIYIPAPWILWVGVSPWQNGNPPSSPSMASAARSVRPRWVGSCCRFLGERS